MNDFVAYWSRWELTKLFLIGAGFVLIGLWMVGAFGAPPTESGLSQGFVLFLGWGSVIFFGLGNVVIAKDLFDTREQLRIGQAGIRWAKWSDQTIPWTEIVNVGTRTFKRQKFIILNLRDRALFPARGVAWLFSGGNRMFTGGDICITLTGTDREFDDAMSAIAYFQPKKLDKSASGT